MKLAFIGIGKVGYALAHNLEAKGHQIAIAHNDATSQSVIDAMAKNPAFIHHTIQDAINWSDLVFLATPFKLNQSILENLEFNGKVLVDCTNPVGPGICHGLQSHISGAEKVQEWAPSSKVVKAFTVYGFENLQNANFLKANIKPVMPIAGNDREAKEIIGNISTELGFNPLDVGSLDQSLHLEHMTLLWVKMVRLNGHNPNFTWAYLERSETKNQH